MIGQLRGVLVVKKPPFLIVDVHGVGYELQASMTTIYELPALGQEVLLYTHFVVREDAQLLYAFYTEQERLLFKELIKVSGVGPKLALTVLSGMNTTTFLQCIAQKDVSRLVKLPGVGKKIAERLVVELQGRLDDKFSVDLPGMAQDSAQDDAVSALVALGYKPQDALASIRKIFSPTTDSETLIRMALQATIK